MRKLTVESAHEQIKALLEAHGAELIEYVRCTTVGDEAGADAAFARASAIHRHATAVFRASKAGQTA